MEERKSFSKTDPDATFMGMKEDLIWYHQMKTGYNVQMGTKDQFIVGFSIHQKPDDTTCMIHHLKAVKKVVGTLPATVVADAGYGSEENHAFLDRRRIRAFVIDTMFRKKKKRAFAKRPTERRTCPTTRNVTDSPARRAVT